MLPLHRQGYTDLQVATALKAGTGFYGCRFELLDHSMRVVGNFDVVKKGSVPTTPGTILEAQVEMDIDRKIAGSITLKMLPDDRLRDVPFQYRIKAYLQVGPMPNGDLIEFPCGVYVWAVPERSIAPGIEEWSIVLGDGLQDFDLGNPALGGFQVWTGERQTDAIARIVQLAGYSDISGVQANGAVFPAPRSWGLSRPQQFLGLTYVPWWQTANLGAGDFYYQTMPGGVGNFISVGGKNPNETRTSTFLDVADDLHAGLGYVVPWMNVNGAYQARPAVDWTTARATVTFGTATDSITITPLGTTNDLSKMCNRVRLWSEASGTPIFFVEADANTIVPGHPLSQAKTKRYADKYITDSTADTQDKAVQQARKELLDGLSMYQRVTFDTLAWPVIEPYDVIGAVVAGDAELGSQQLFQERKYSLNLMSGVMSHEANRVYQVS